MLSQVEAVICHFAGSQVAELAALLKKLTEEPRREKRHFSLQMLDP
jgi:hypothetical protein